MSETWYEMRRYSERIYPVQVVGVTDSFVKIPAGGTERKEKKVSSYGGYYRTWEDAREALIVYREKEVETAQQQLEYAAQKLNEARQMEKPE